MDKQNSDRRIRKTKKLLKDTFIELLNEKPMEKISVKDLTEKADLNRGTFYLHYTDIYDLLEQSENELLGEMSEILSKIDPAAFNIFHQENKPYPPLVHLFEWFDSNKDFGKVLVGPNGDISFLEKISITGRNEILKSKNKFYEKTNNMAIIPYLNSFMIFGFVGVIKQWYESDMPIPPKEMAKIFVQILYRNPDSLLGFAQE